jgi:hypothetical protein
VFALLENSDLLGNYGGELAPLRVDEDLLNQVVDTQLIHDLWAT